MATKTITVKNDVKVTVTTSVQTFSVTFSPTTNIYYKVTWTSGGLGTAPANLAARRDGYTYPNVPYGAQYKVEYLSAGGYSTSANPKTGTVTGIVAIGAPSESYYDYDDRCGCGNE